MTENFSELNQTFNIESKIVEVERVKEDLPISSDNFEHIKKDYEYTRTNLYSLIQKGQEAINGIIEIASEGGSPRAYEVAGQLIKNVSDVTDKLMDLQKKLKDIEDSGTQTTNNVTNNAVFIGSTSELSKLLKKGFLNNKE